MGWIERWKRNWSDDPFQLRSRLIVLSGQKVYVAGVKQLLHITKRRIMFQAIDRTITIGGERLMMEQWQRGEFVVYGEIELIQFGERK